MKHFSILFSLLFSLCLPGRLDAFVAPLEQMSSPVSSLSMAQSEEDLLRWARSSRSAGSDDNVVELLRPLGLVLNQDDNGNVYVETVAPKGNAARTGKVWRKVEKMKESCSVELSLILCTSFP